MGAAPRVPPPARIKMAHEIALVEGQGPPPAAPTLEQTSRVPRSRRSPAAAGADIFKRTRSIQWIVLSSWTLQISSSVPCLQEGSPVASGDVFRSTSVAGDWPRGRYCSDPDESGTVFGTVTRFNSAPHGAAARRVFTLARTFSERAGPPS